MAKIAMQVTADQAKAAEELRKLQGQVDQLHQKMKEGGRESKKETDSWTTSVVGLAAGYMSISTAINLAKTALADLNAERQRAVQLTQATLGPAGQLAQLPGFQANLSAVGQTIAETGMDPQRAMNLQFALQSGQLGQERYMFGQVSHLLLPGQEAELVGGVKKFGEAFGAAAGTPEQRLNMFMKGSEQAVATIGEFGPAATILAERARQTGASPEEVVAVLATLSQRRGSISQGAEQAGAFTKVLATEGIMGQGLLGGAEAIRAMGMTPQQEIKFFGREQARQAYLGIIGGAGDIRSRMQEISGVATIAPGETPYWAQRVGEFLSVPEYGAEVAARRAEGVRGITEQKQESAFASQQRAVLARFDDLARQGRIVGVGRWAMNRGLGAYARTGMSPEELATMGAGFLAQNAPGQAGETQEQAMKRFTDALMDFTSTLKYQTGGGPAPRQLE